MSAAETATGAPLEVSKPVARPTQPSQAGKGRSCQVVLCLPSNGAVDAVHLRVHRGNVQTRHVHLATAPEATRLMKEAGNRCPVIALLPKSLYLLRTFEVPKVLPDEVPRMLLLEASAMLPPEFGAVEVSYRPVSVRRENYERYEVYIARRDELSAYVSALADLGIRPDIVLPSAFPWGCLLNLASGTGLLVAALGSSQLEAASWANDGTLSIRTIDPGSTSETGMRYERGLAECVRPLLATIEGGDSPLVIGWLGDDCPHHLANGRIAFRNAPEALRQMPAPSPPADRMAVILSYFAAALVEHLQAPALGTSNLLPSDMIARQHRRAIRQAGTWASGLFLLATILASVAMRVVVQRYQSRITQLSGKIEAIKKEGEAVGRRIEQLEAIRSSRTSHNDFELIVAGLYDSAPQGLSYSSVELDDRENLRLQGQADSLAVAFLLPQQLQNTGVFKEVQPGDASRSRRGEGAIAEFRVDCRLNRKRGS